MNYLLKGVSLLAIASLGVSPSLADGHEDKATDEVVVEGKVLYSDQVNALKNYQPLSWTCHRVHKLRPVRKFLIEALMKSAISLGIHQG